MVSYKKMYEELKKDYNKLRAWSIDLTPEVVEYRKKNKFPLILKKSLFRFEEEGDNYLLYDV